MKPFFSKCYKTNESYTDIGKIILHGNEWCQISIRLKNYKPISSLYEGRVKFASGNLINELL